jgi:hypothetical protein
MGLPLRPAAALLSKSNAACGDYVTVLKVTDEATDAPQTARAGKKLSRDGFCQRRLRRDAAPSLVKLHLRYPSSVMNCLYVAFDVSSAYRYPNASRNASNF